MHSASGLLALAVPPEPVRFLGKSLGHPEVGGAMPKLAP